jgi:high-affinity Fe2+/Pb2+ permease
MMKALWRTLALIALLATLVPAFLVFFGLIDLGTQKGIMTIGMILWFVAAPLYMRKEKS